MNHDTDLKKQDESTRLLQVLSRSEAIEWASILVRRKKGREWTASAAESQQVERIVECAARTRLDIELALAWADRLSLKEIAQGLESALQNAGNLTPAKDEQPEQVPPSLVFNWTAGLLDKAVGDALARVGLFASSWTAESAAALCELSDATAVLESLQHAALLTSSSAGGVTRYRLRGPIRDWASAMLCKNPNKEGVQRLFIQWFCTAAKEVSPGLKAETDRKVEALAWFRAEWPNLLCAAELAFAAKDWESCLALASASFGAWDDLEMLSEVERLYDMALTASRSLNDRRKEESAIRVLGLIYDSQGRWAQAEDFLKHSVKFSRELKDPEKETWALHALGFFYNSQGRWAEAENLLRKSLVMIRQQGDQNGEMVAVNNLGNALENSGKFAEAESCFEKSLQLARELKDRFGELTALIGVGNVKHDQLRLAEAEEAFQKALMIARELGARRSEGVLISNLSLVYEDQGRKGEALEACEEALGLLREARDWQNEVFTRARLGLLYAEASRIGEAEACYEEALRICRQVGDRLHEAQLLGNYSEIKENEGDLPRALELARTALEAFQETEEESGLEILKDRIQRLEGAPPSDRSSWFSKIAAGWPSRRAAKRRVFDATEFSRLTEGEGAPRRFLKYVTATALARAENHHPGAMFNATSILTQAGDLEQAKALAREITVPHIKRFAFEKIAEICAYSGRVQEALRLLDTNSCSTPIHSESQPEMNWSAEPQWPPPDEEEETFALPRDHHISGWASSLAKSGRLTEAVELAHAVEGRDREMVLSSIVEDAIDSGPTAEMLAKICQLGAADWSVALALESLCERLLVTGKLQQAVETAELIREKHEQTRAFRKIARAFQSSGKARDYCGMAARIQGDTARDMALCVAVDLLVEEGDLPAAVEAASAIGSHWGFPPPFDSLHLDGKNLTESTVRLGENISNRSVLQGFMTAVGRSFQQSGKLEEFADIAEKCSEPARHLAFHALMREFTEQNDFGRAKEYNDRIEEEALRKQGFEYIAKAKREGESRPEEWLERLKTQLLTLTGTAPTPEIEVDSKIEIGTVLGHLLKQGLTGAAKKALVLIQFVRPADGRKVALEGAASALCCSDHKEALFDWLAELDTPEDRNVALEAAASHFSYQDNLKLFEQCLLKMENPETVQNACEIFAFSKLESVQTGVLLSRIAHLKDSSIRDQLRKAVADQLMRSGKIAAGKEFLDQLEKTEIQKAREPEMVGPPATEKDAAALMELGFDTDSFKKFAAHALQKSGFVEEAIEMATRIAEETERLLTLSGIVSLGLESKARKGDIEGAIRLAFRPKDRSKQFDLLIEIAHALGETINPENLSKVLAEAFKIAQKTEDLGEKTLQLLEMAGVIASQTPRPLARELKRAFSSSDKTWARKVLGLLPA